MAEEDGETAGESERVSCPFCKEKVLKEATKCRYCGSQLAASGPSHGGTCPMCREKIHPEALKCRYCATMLVVTPAESRSSSPCCGGCSGSSSPPQSQMSVPPEFLHFASGPSAGGPGADASQMKALAARMGISDAASACNQVCLWFCPRDSQGGIGVGCFLKCLGRCSVFEAPGYGVFK